MACRILVPLPGMKPGPLAVRAWSPNHWTVREVPSHFLVLFCFLKPKLPPLHFIMMWHLKCCLYASSEPECIIFREIFELKVKEDDHIYYLVFQKQLFSPVGSKYSTLPSFNTRFPNVQSYSRTTNKMKEAFNSKMKWKSLSHVQIFVTPWSIQSMEFSRPEY